MDLNNDDKRAIVVTNHKNSHTNNVNHNDLGGRAASSGGSMSSEVGQPPQTSSRSRSPVASNLTSNNPPPLQPPPPVTIVLQHRDRSVLTVKPCYCCPTRSLRKQAYPILFGLICIVFVAVTGYAALSPRRLRYPFILYVYYWPFANGVFFLHTDPT